MRTSESVDALFEALAKFQGEVKNPEKSATANIVTKKGDRFSYSYATLPDILSDIRPLLAKNGLALVQSPSSGDGGIILTSLLTHKSGQWIEFCPLSMPFEGGVQIAGGVITYLRRYAVCSILGIAGEEDDDATVANPSTSSPATQSKPKQDGPAPKTAGGATVRQRDYARNLLCDIGVCKHGKPKETEDARNARRDNNVLGIISWFEAHDITVRDEEAPLEMLTFEEMSALIEALLERKTELEVPE